MVIPNFVVFVVAAAVAVSADVDDDDKRVVYDFPVRRFVDIYSILLYRVATNGSRVGGTVDADDDAVLSVAIGDVRLHSMEICCY